MKTPAISVIVPMLVVALSRGQISPFPSCDRDVIDACAREATTDSQGNTDEELYEMLRVSFGTNNMGDPVNPVELCRIPEIDTFAEPRLTACITNALTNCSILYFFQEDFGLTDTQILLYFTPDPTWDLRLSFIMFKYMCTPECDNLDIRQNMTFNCLDVMFAKLYDLDNPIEDPCALFKDYESCVINSILGCPYTAFMGSKMSQPYLEMMTGCDNIDFQTLVRPDILRDTAYWPEVMAIPLPSNGYTMPTDPPATIPSTDAPTTELPTTQPTTTRFFIDIGHFFPSLGPQPLIPINPEDLRGDLLGNGGTTTLPAESTDDDDDGDVIDGTDENDVIANNSTETHDISDERRSNNTENDDVEGEESEENGEGDIGDQTGSNDPKGKAAGVLLSWHLILATSAIGHHLL